MYAFVLDVNQENASKTENNQVNEPKYFVE
jgi:hypothetical protein